MRTRTRGPRRLLARAGSLAAAAVAAALALVALGTARVQDALGQDGMGGQDEMGKAADGGCLSCHRGIEDVHPWAPVPCTQCHGGDSAATTKERAHVAPKQRLPGDERTLGQAFDPELLRFLDPGNLRVASQSCGPCHSKACEDVPRSLHATTSGHLADGLYENGVVSEKHPPVSIFNVRDPLPDDAPRPAGAVPFLRQIGAFATGGERERVSTHFTDLPRKACMQCHLWSRGRAVRGRAGMDGDYRGEGCSACHVPYADDGLSQSRDPTANRFEPGHPREHRMVRFPDTTACTRCHYGDASIGLSFRGLGQPVPGMPQSPDAPGLHRKRLNGVYYVDDPASTPADVHHQRGMHCVDCHTRNDVMGDGFLHKRMEDAVEIACETCHGTNEEYATGVTRKGTKLPHLERTKDGTFLVGRVTGTRHRVKQSRDVVRPGSADYNAAAALAMNADHGRVACHTCHSGWNPNFFGFHFDRNEAFTQLDILSGQRTPGRVTTQEKVFSTFKHFSIGWDSHGRAAPYMVGFSSMATVHDKDGGLVLDQELPVTRGGLSGMTMIHHQTHTTTSRARQCAECHRSPTALGRGSVNHRLAREFVAVGGDLGVHLVAIDRKTPANTVVTSTLAVADVGAVAFANDRLTGRATWLYAASSSEGLVAADVSFPGFPRVASRTKSLCASPKDLLHAGRHLYLADGDAGLRIVDISSPSAPRQRALVALPSYGLHLDGTTLFVAAGTKGLAAVDVRNPDAPRVVLEGLDLNGADTATVDARSVATLFQFSRPHPDIPEGPRSRAVNVAAVGTAAHGVWIVDVTEPGEPRVLRRPPPQAAEPVPDVALGTLYELGSEGGALPTRERDFVFSAVAGRGSTFDVTDLTDPTRAGESAGVSLDGRVQALRVARVYNAPFLQTFVIAVTDQGLQIVDVTRPMSPVVVATVAGVRQGRAVDLEEFPLDRAVDADGTPLLDVSHEGARWFSQSEALRVLGAPLLDVGDLAAPAGGDR